MVTVQKLKLNIGGMMFWYMDRVLLNWNGWEFWAATALMGSVDTDTACGLSNCNAKGGSLASWPGFEESVGVTFSFDCELSKSDSCSFWLSEVRLYSRTPSRLWWLVCSIISCSSMLAWYNLVAVTAHREWFENQKSLLHCKDVRQCLGGGCDQLVSLWTNSLASAFSKDGSKKSHLVFVWAIPTDKAWIASQNTCQNLLDCHDVVTVSATNEVENVLRDEGVKLFQFTQGQLVTFFHCLLSITRVVAMKHVPL